MKNSFILLAALAMVSISCTKEISGNAPAVQENHDLNAKLVGGHDGEAVPGTLLVRLDAQSVKAIEEGRFSEIAEELLPGVEATSFTSALPVKPKNMEVARKYGLDQWFIVSYDPQTRPETVAERIEYLFGVLVVISVAYVKPLLVFHNELSAGIFEILSLGFREGLRKLARGIYVTREHIRYRTAECLSAKPSFNNM